MCDKDMNLPFYDLLSSVVVSEVTLVWKRFAGKKEMFYSLEGFQFCQHAFFMPG